MNVKIDYTNNASMGCVYVKESKGLHSSTKQVDDAVHVQM